MIKRLGNQAGYSLVEVMVSIMILTIAILPMVSMFDAGLRSAALGGNYDTARALANKHLERARMLPYESVQRNYPFDAPTTAPMAGGSYTSPERINVAATPHDVPQGFSYKVTKQYKAVPASGESVDLANSATDQGIIEVSVTVSWRDNEYTATGLKAR